ncbi:hypothetical protein GH714_028783 [Hevea brasiliensis]|uniref:Purple acid phosphatase n=1 Tax=Hevea brasiliensis TaxID=3981 RepID=A0A6A6NJM9_HEVBR|nr:hypothetical protein GH714_028783 [Hevea brasiliensis]
MVGLRLIFSAILLLLAFQEATSHGDNPLSRIAIHKSTFALTDLASIKASPSVLGLTEQNSGWVTLEYSNPIPSVDDWIGVFSPANFSASTCPSENPRVYPPLLCSAPIKYQYANYSSPKYKDSGNGSLKLQLINQRSDFSFALFAGGFLNPKLVAVSNTVAFSNPNAPVYPRLAQGRTWNEMAITWTSGYGINEAEPFIEWAPEGGKRQGRGKKWKTLEIHLKEWYSYKLGHKLFNGTCIWSQQYQFRASPYPGQNSVQRVVIFGGMGKGEVDGSSEYNDFQPGSLNTTKQLIRELNNIDIVFHIGDICYANGYLSQWDQFTAQIEPIASTVPYMIASGNHERDWPGTGSFYGNMDSGENVVFWLRLCSMYLQRTGPSSAQGSLSGIFSFHRYSTDYGMFRFCVADTEHDWREGTEQYKFIENCLASVDRQKQPWLIFLAHRVLGYSSCITYAIEGSFEEPMGRESLQKLWQKYKVDIAMYGHVHNYERTCPIYQINIDDFLHIHLLISPHC